MSRPSIFAVALLAWTIALPSSAQQSVPVVRLVAREYSFTAPGRIAAGLVRVRVVNRGTVPHYARLVRLDSAKTLADVNAWRRVGGRPPAWYVPVGGPAPIAPGDSAETAVVLSPGRHIVFCTYPMHGGTSVHLDSGMVRELMVDDGRSATAPNASLASLDADATLIVGEFGFSALPPLRAGRRQIRVTNGGRLAHQVLLVRLPAGVTEDDELAWFRGSYRTTRPGRPSGGLLEVKPRETSWFSVWLTPGRYLFLCAFADGTTRHFDKGMTRVIDVSR